MHLSSQEALDLIEARATEEQARFWDAHLEGCSSCRKQLTEWKEMHSLLKRESLENAPESALRIADAIFEPSAVGQSSGLRSVIASVLFDSFAQPALAGARGAAGARQFLLAADGIDIHVRISNVGMERRITGQILSRNTEHEVNRAQLHLLGNGKRVVTTSADEFGEFEFSEVPDGPLQLQIELPHLIVTGALNPS